MCGLRIEERQANVIVSTQPFMLAMESTQADVGLLNLRKLRMDVESDLPTTVLRIRKLLRLAKSPNPHEAQLAAERATSDLALYGLEVNDVLFGVY